MNNKNEQLILIPKTEQYILELIIKIPRIEKMQVEVKEFELILS